MKKTLFYILILFSCLLNSQTTFNYSWAKSFGSNLNEETYQSKIDLAGNVYITGRIEGVVDFDPSAATYTLNEFQHCFLAKYDPSGALMWAKVLSGTGTSFGNGLGVDASGNIFVTGYFNGNVAFNPALPTLTTSAIGNSDMFLSKFDSNGSLLWNKTVGGAFTQVNPNDLKVMPTGEIVITGEYSQLVDFDASASTYTLLSTSASQDIFVLKYDALGNFNWVIGVGDISSDSGSGIEVDASGNIYVTGQVQNTPDFNPSASTATFSPYGQEDVFIAKYTSAGGYVWADVIGGTSKDIGYRIKLDAAGDILVTGIMQSTAFDADPSPAPFNLIKVGSGVFNVFLGKYNSSTGALIWAKNTGGNGSNGMGAYSITSDQANNIYLCGFFDGSTDFDFTSGITTFSPYTTSGSDIFIAKYDNSGNYILAQNIGGATGSGNEAYSINVNSLNEIVVSGNFISTPDFDFSAATNTLSSMGGKDCFFAKYTQCISPTTPTLSTNNATICAGGSFTFSVSNGSLNSASNWVWSSGICGTNTVALGNTVTLTPTITTTYYVRGEGGCIIPGVCATGSIVVSPLKTISGQVTTTASAAVAGLVVLYKYEGGFTKYDSLSYQNLDALGNYSFSSIPAGSYILQAVPSASNLQTTYGNNATSWKNATVLNHGCVTNTVQNITMVDHINIGGGPGMLSGVVTKGQGYGQKTSHDNGILVGPIKGAVIKGGRNPGGNYFASERTNSAGQYSFTNIPICGPGESYFILVDIAGLDTNGTYHAVVTASNSVFNNLDFIADSAKINPVNFVGVTENVFSDKKVIIYPNPSNGIINIETKSVMELEEVSYKITDILGNEILSMEPKGDTTQINLSKFNKGIYFLCLKTKADQKTIKIILTN
ncbi:MAG: T9SS type A sorting domain-containing protein [Bacteroidota bacterium]|nr:T9SS type A sorting domain-containing protein [Bacteroidota bacterium]